MAAARRYYVQDEYTPCAHSCPLPVFPMTPKSAPLADVHDHIPLTAVAFDILLALSGGDQHGYAIMRAVEERTGGPAMHAGTLYRALARLVDTGLIEETEGGAEGGDERRRYYRITGLGRDVAAAEALRLEAQVSAARAQGLLGGVRPA